MASNFIPLYQDGFDVQFPVGAVGLWTAIAGSNSRIEYTDAIARSGMGALRIWNSSALTGGGKLSRTVANTSDFYVGFGFYMASGQELDQYNGSNVLVMRFNASNGGGQCALTVNDSTLQLQAIRGHENSATLLQASTSSLSYDAWHYIEAHVVVSDSVGVMTVKVNGATWIDVSGEDTKAQADAGIDSIQIGTGSGQGAGSTKHDFYFDDYVYGTTDFPGQPVVIPFVPNADGAHSAWASTDVDIHSAIDELGTYGNTPDTASYLTGSSVSDSVSVGLTDLGRTGQVLGVQIATYLQKSDTGAAEVDQFFRLSGTDHVEGAISPSTSWNWAIHMSTQNPDTVAPWTVSGVDALELGWTKTT